MRAILSEVVSRDAFKKKKEMKQHAEIFFFSLHGSSNVQLEIFIRPVALLFF